MFSASFARKWCAFDRSSPLQHAFELAQPLVTLERRRSLAPAALQQALLVRLDRGLLLLGRIAGRLAAGFVASVTAHDDGHDHRSEGAKEKERKRESPHSRDSTRLRTIRSPSGYSPPAVLCWDAPFRCALSRRIPRVDSCFASAWKGIDDHCSKENELWARQELAVSARARSHGGGLSASRAPRRRSHRDESSRARRQGRAVPGRIDRPRQRLALLRYGNAASPSRRTHSR